MITKNSQGSLEHKGKRLCKYSDTQKVSKQDVKENISENEKIEILKMKLKKAVREEKYEEAAEIRDEIKKLQN